MIKIDRPTCPYPQALNNGNYKHKTNKDALREASSDKCMYCESKISHIDHAHVEHIKPKSDDRFPELKFVWENLGYSCPKCNNSKSNKYDIDTPYIDPYVDEPSEHVFAFGAFVFANNGSERGEITIRDTDINRGSLIEKRQERINEIVKALTACFRTSNASLRVNAINELKREALGDKEYSLVVKALLIAKGIEIQ
ncbi:MAG TPA: HNH endonuclease [Flavobacteriales bacterium]|nr:HNH endonuclease [Flavobacteriales bacterium]